MRKWTFLLLGAYTTFLFLVLLRHVQVPDEQAILSMGFGLFLIWVVVGGIIQRNVLAAHFERYTTPAAHPVISFAFTATVLACIEEAIATALTNLAPFFGGRVGESFITASTNYFHVIFFHSVIVFVPMFFMLGWLLKKYEISPFQTFILFGSVGVLAEFTLAGPAVFLNAPFWILVYGLMVYLPSHRFVRMQRKKLSVAFYPLLIPLIAFSAVATFWIPILFETGNHFLK